MHILKIFSLTIFLLLGSEVIRPGMMLIPENGRLEAIFDLELASSLVRWGSIAYLGFELLRLFSGKAVLDGLSALIFIFLSAYFVRNFFIMW
ncbi:MULTISPECIES: hypothetical protein [unclassified Marinobacter]|jgi:hypothetical protein|uniref:hypothetical protein n=1 Tax=unclassified Marinobacter TaxID=83889 RepID=UPI002E2224A7